MYPIVYPMLTTLGPDNIEWSVEPHVRSGLLSDIYLYVSGASMWRDRMKTILNAIGRPACNRYRIAKRERRMKFKRLSSRAVNLFSRGPLPSLLKTLCRSEEHTSELQSRGHLVCRLLLEKKNA